MSPDEIITIRFDGSDGSDGRTPVRRHSRVDFLQGKKRLYRVYSCDGGYAIHVRVDFPHLSKPDNKLTWWLRPGGVPSNGQIHPTELLYGLELMDGQRKGLLVEGEKCADAARAPVLPSSWLVCATVCGAASEPEKDVLDRLALIPTWFLWPDADRNGAGQQHMARIAAHMARQVKVRVVTWPDAPDGGDVADFLQRHGRSELIALLRAAERVR